MISAIIRRFNLCQCRYSWPTFVFHMINPRAYSLICTRTHQTTNISVVRVKTCSVDAFFILLYWWKMDEMIKTHPVRSSVECTSWWSPQNRQVRAKRRRSHGTRCFVLHVSAKPGSTQKLNWNGYLVVKARYSLCCAIYEDISLLHPAERDLHWPKCVPTDIPFWFQTHSHTSKSKVTPTCINVKARNYNSLFCSFHCILPTTGGSHKFKPWWFPFQKTDKRPEEEPSNCR